MDKQILIAGGGIGGLATALAASRAGWEVQLFERTPQFGIVGVGIQIGPNVVRVLRNWGLEGQLKQVAAFPEMLRVRSAANGAELGRLRLGETVRKRYGAPYATLHRADLHELLLGAVRQADAVDVQLGRWFQSYSQTHEGVQVELMGGASAQGQALIGADGLWSAVRQQMLGDGPPQITGHLAYRGLVDQHALPAFLRSQQVTVWMGPDLHVVQYPVRGGHWMNVVAIVNGHIDAQVDDWDHEALSNELGIAMGATCNRLQDLLSAIPQWRLWALCDRPPMAGPREHAQGRIALMGDAAHPMRPYLAQGAGMAIEDAACLEKVLTGSDLPIAQSLAAFAALRWRRNARVQARSQRNGRIFHAQGLMRWGRDLSISLLGERILDVPWLYRG